MNGEGVGSEAGRRKENGISSNEERQRCWETAVVGCWSGLCSSLVNLLATKISFWKTQIGFWFICIILCLFFFYMVLLRFIFTYFYLDTKIKNINFSSSLSYSFVVIFFSLHHLLPYATLKLKSPQLCFSSSSWTTLNPWLSFSSSSSNYQSSLTKDLNTKFRNLKFATKLLT